MLRLLRHTAVLLSALRVTLAQTSTDCNPLNKTCPSDTGSTHSSLHYDFVQSSETLAQWSTLSGSPTIGTEGVELTINEEGQAPTIATPFYIFFGEISVVMKASAGTGIISSIVLESDDLDEVDWEILGSYTTELQTDYFGKGDSSTSDRWTWEPVDGPQSTFHNYTLTWTPAALTWSIDGTAQRTLTYSDAADGTRYPQTPSRIKIGIWAGGDPNNSAGTISWAGGETNYSQAPFTMVVQTVDIVNYYPAESYTYSDESGDFESIVMEGGTMTSLSASAADSGSGAAQDVPNFGVTRTTCPLEPI
ncbi:glycoside hydrolase family 16 protein [Aspergillus fijiensis CBS 313.89]|uniref:chitinase n=1 Tax=Aspergillus fijiensis CBS 313.89 TaxID=1448319 RepID=A0A8G1RU80_9EURO|nr:extracellular cell wall glucanase Crf1/allergen Asp F9 [Aspergillus fijiensis CBS 313.89]RAK78988.1 extracellular cell wall glucanase Crf1/allergen Asp F9 [Aspergillus fijiensis CBS 313.89]